MKVHLVFAGGKILWNKLFKLIKILSDNIWLHKILNLVRNGGKEDPLPLPLPPPA